MSDDGIILQFAPMMASTYAVSDVMNAHIGNGLDMISKVPFILLKSDRDKKQSGGNVVCGYEVMIICKKTGKTATMNLSAMADASNIIVAPVSPYIFSTIYLLCIWFVNKPYNSCALSVNSSFVCSSRMQLFAL